ncbi:MAG: nuclear transport factor 2 family protein [Pseudomonadota bacterium]
MQEHSGDSAGRDEELARLIAFYETLTPASVARVADLYAADAHFKDPFNEVRGTAAIGAIFTHMFVQVLHPRFVVTNRMVQGDQAFLAWNFHFRMKRFLRAEQCVRGATHVRFDQAGRVALHRDYWDAAEELYEKLPVLGGLMRVLKRAGRR